MKNTKRSITLKVLAGYLLIALLIVVGVWFIYPQIKTFIYPEKESETTTKKLTYTSNALSYLYEAETIGRTAMATGSQDQYKQYELLVDSITPQLDSLQEITRTKEQIQQLDSIKILLVTKTSNIRAMVQLRSEQYSRNYYDEALAKLIKEDIYFEDYKNDPRLDSVDAYTKKVVVDYLEYLRKDNADPDQNLTTMAKTVRETLAKIEDQKKQLEIDIINKENNLLKNDREINLKIRTLLSSFEQEGLLSAKQREDLLNSRIAEVSQTLKIIGIISIVLALGFVIMIFKDASRSHQYNKELQKSNAVSQSLLKSREQLMATITHDMRSPLNTVIGFTDLLKDTQTDPTQSRYLETIAKSGDYMLQLVNDLLDFSKLEAGKINIEKIPFNPKNLIEDVIAVAIPSEIKPDVSITIKVPEELDRLLLSDPFRIKQILSNLITNAYKFTDAGTVTVTASRIKENLVIGVEDTGIGIAKNKQELIFKEFSQAEDHISQKYGGFGLGLSISQKLADLLNGKLSLESELGEGSKFTLSIPVEETVSKEKKTDFNFTSELNKVAPKNILLVDDEPLQITLAQESLKNYPYRITTSINGKDALEKLANTKYDLILTDIQMPVLDGIELIKQIRKNPKFKTIPVIALSGNGLMEAKDYTKLGFTQSLRKPYKPKHLIAAIEGLKIPEGNLAENKNKPEGYTLNALNEFADNDRDSLNTILQVFIESTEANLSLLQKKEQSTFEINQIAHKMLPMMRQLDAKELVSLLEKLEQPELKNSSNKVINSLIRVVEKKAIHLVKNLRKEIKA